ncbi:MAG: PDZ domain-containing protein, partial [Actinobacteria bacterium]|nr:PDZ domain-containing protein [Actinomycetota bacterium]
RGRNPAVTQTMASGAYGIIGGVIGSFILTLIGIPFALESSGFLYLWAVAIGLALISPRLMCFSYAGGLLMVSRLLLGWPSLEIPQIAALVALLHIIESLLIWLDGHTSAIPMAIRNRQGEVVGGFTLQRMWPVPFTLMIAVSSTLTTGEQVNMPNWWPLMKLTGPLATDPNLILGLFPVVAGVGYGDIAITTTPAAKARRSARNLAVYSVALLAAAILASHYSPFLWIAALLTPLGHEAVAYLSGRGELSGKPHWKRPDRGVRVLDIFPGSPGEEIGLRPGSIITSTSGQDINTRQELRDALEAATAYSDIHFTLPDGREIAGRIGRPEAPDEGELGIILLPEPGDEPLVEVGHRGLILTLIRKGLGRLRNR